RKSFLSDILCVVVTSLYQKERFSSFLREKGCPKVTFGTPSFLHTVTRTAGIPNKAPTSLICSRSLNFHLNGHRLSSDSREKNGKSLFISHC
ncbi:hypothetical protein, partial [Aneurinibacillus aneurinilyticus]|uniref:hypothetical protein n=1 Tax=Aneurinibacillus aneurinilyticus TaxID=1391 RepID=UPI0023F9719C